MIDLKQVFLKEVMGVSPDGDIVDESDLPTLQDLSNVKHLLDIAVRVSQNVWFEMGDEEDDWDYFVSKILIRALMILKIPSFMHENSVCVQLADGSIIAVEAIIDDNDQFEEVRFFKYPAWQKDWKKNKKSDSQS